MTMFNDVKINNKWLSEFHVVPSGAGTWSAPKRDVTRYSVPGRSGDIVIDNGRFQNATVSYKCNITEDFKTNYEALKDYLLSLRGYLRIEDTYHEGFYRLGLIDDDILPDVTELNREASFDLSFTCKPQRYYVSGDEPYPSSLAGGRKSNTATSMMFDMLPDAVKYELKDRGLDDSGEWLEVYASVPVALTNQNIVLTDWEGHQNGTLVVYNTVDEVTVSTTGKIRKSAQAGVTYQFYVKNRPGLTITWGSYTLYTDGLKSASRKMVTIQGIKEAKPIVKLTIDASATGKNVHGNAIGINEACIHLDYSGAVDHHGESAKIKKLTVDCDLLTAWSDPDDNTLGVKINMNPYVRIIGSPVLDQTVNYVGYCTDLIEAAEMYTKEFAL